MEELNDADIEYIRQFNIWDRSKRNNDWIKIWPIWDYITNADWNERIIVLDKWCGFIKIPVPQRVY
jgi:hypothetical protein